MRIFSFFATALLFILPLKSGSNQVDGYSNIAISTCSGDNVTFRDSEELTYKIYYNWGLVWLSAGEATFRVQEQKNGYLISAVGKTYPAYEWLYSVNDRYEVFVDKSTLLPIWSVRDIRENNYTQYERMDFNQSTGKVTSRRGKNKSETTTAVISVNDCTHDILSILYFVRNYPFNTFRNGQVFPVNVFLDRENNNLTAKYKGTVKKHNVRGLGNFNSFVITPATIEGKVFEKGNTMKMYISEDENQIPLMVETSLKVGNVKVILKSYKNLRYSLKSKVN